MGIFGWSYPPGCSGPPDDDLPCEVCGVESGNCECPECPVCGEYGRTECYLDHGLELAPWQIKGLQRLLDDEHSNCLSERRRGEWEREHGESWW